MFKSRVVRVKYNPKPIGVPHWIDNADSYICSVCGYETNNPNKNPCGSKRCPECNSKMEY